VTLAGALARIDFTDLDNFASGFPHHLFAVHRREAPVYWHDPTDNTPDGEGFWSVATYAETVAVFRDPGTFSSMTGGSRPFGGTLLQDLSIAGQVLNMMDDPRARGLLDEVVAGEPLDFLVDIAAELPMQMICILLGVPESDRHWLFHAIEPQFDFGEARRARIGTVGQMSVEEAGSRMYAYGLELIASKRENPTDDLLSIVANATLDDDGTSAPLPELELYLFFSLLFSAGAETTRNAIAGGLLALADHPGQLRALRSDLGLLPTAAEEMVRWTSPPDARSRPARRSRSGSARPTATSRCSPTQTLSISAVNRIRTWASVRECITAWAPTWPGWSCECCSRSCWLDSRR
jgi:cytochrome P450